MAHEPPLRGVSLWQQLGDRLEAGRFRPQARQGIVVHRRCTRDGEPFLVACNPERTAAIRLLPWQHDVLQAMDGTRTVKDLLLRHFQQQGALDLEGVATLAAALRARGFLVQKNRDIYADLRRTLRPHARPRRLLARLGNALGRRWAIPLADRLLAGIFVAAGRLARSRSVLGSAALLTTAGLLALAVEVLRRDMSVVAVGGTPLGAALALLIILWLAGAIQGLARGVAGQALGWTPRIGAGLRFGLPIIEVEQGDMALAAPREALIARLAGVWGLLLCAALAALAALLVPRGLGEVLLLAALLASLLGSLLLVPLLGPERLALLVDEGDVESRGRGFRLGAGARLAQRLCSLLGPLLAGLLLLAALRAQAGDLLAGLWHEADIPARAILGAAALSMLICGGLQVMAPWLSGPVPQAGQRRSGRRRYLSRQMRERLALIRLCPSVASLTDEQQVALAQRVAEVHYPEGFDVVVQGEAGQYFYLVMDGLAEVIDEGGPNVLGQLQRGSSFGEYAMLYRTLRAATVRAITPLRLLRIDRATFDAYLAPKLALQERLAALSHERAALAAVPSLAPLGPQARDLLLPRLIVERYEPGEVIIRQGMPGDRFYILRSGTVEVLDERQSPPRRLNVLGIGAYFGEIALLLDTPRVATVRALVEVTVWSLSRADFDQVLGRYLGLTEAFTAAAHERLAANRSRSVWPETSLGASI